jgi:hypothetical protein
MSAVCSRAAKTVARFDRPQCPGNIPGIAHTAMAKISAKQLKRFDLDDPKLPAAI